MSVKKINEKKLEKLLVPLVKEANEHSCYGFSIATDGKGNSWTNCMCAGNNNEQHDVNTTSIFSLIEQMVDIVKKETGIENVFRLIGTYDDYYFCYNDGDKIKLIIGIDENGIIKDSREYA